MTDLLELTMKAHGGLEKFNWYSFLRARLHQGGVLWGLKGQPTVPQDAQVSVDLKQQRVSHRPFAPTDNHSEYTPTRVTINSPTDEVVEELDDPRPSFAGYAMETPGVTPRSPTSPATRCGPI